MTRQQLVSEWVGLEERHPALHRAGVGVLVLLAAAVPAMELGKLPRPPQPGLALLVVLLALLGLLFGRRVLWNDRERRLRTAWRLVGFVFISGLLGWAASSLGLIPPRGSRTALLSGQGMVRLSLGRLGLSLAAAVAAVRLLDRQPVSALGIAPTRAFWKDLGFGLFMGVLLMSLIFATELSLGWLRITEVAGAPADSSFALGILRVVVVFLCVGIYEELTSRGYMLRNLAQGFSVGKVGPAQAVGLAILLSSALFGLGHAGNPNATVVSSLNIAIAGVLLALPYALTGRLGGSIGLHVTWNLFQGGVYGFPVSGMGVPTSLLRIEQGGPAVWTGGEFGPEAGLLCILACVLGGVLFVARERWIHGTAGVFAALADPFAGRALPPPAPAPAEPLPEGPADSEAAPSMPPA